MEINTILGIGVAVILILIGIRLILKKPADQVPSLESDLHIDEDSQQPIIPRHVRSQLAVDSTTPATEERIEPNLETANVEAKNSQGEEKPLTEVASNEKAKEEKEVLSEEVLSEAVDVEKAATFEAQHELQQSVTQEIALEEVEAQGEKNQQNETIETLSLGKVEKADIQDFDDESSILEAHLYEQKIADDECALANAETFIVLNVYPERRALSGEKTLKVLMKYGLRFGEMACFHRYSEDGAKLLFSVLQITDEGAAGFDLETLSTEEIKGLAFFLALPHNDVQNAFDVMDSIARLISREVEGTVYDQNNQELTPQLKEHWRHQAIDYKAS